MRLLKYGDSLYRCKSLKRAALGRMATVMKKLNASLGYLEQVRQHLSRLPSIDPTERTVIVCGYPNVGKSSFMNKVTRADVEVQPYPFTTKSLFLGHMDYRAVRWQVIDTPGILDRPLEERNTIEMVAITALAHLRAAVLYFVDISEQCGHSITAQLELFNSISPLFANKPLMVVQTKVDVVRPEALSAETQKLFADLQAKGTAIGSMSSLQEVGVMETRNTICDMLLAQRNDRTVRSAHFKTVLNRLHVATPQARDGKAREPIVPASVEARKNGMDVDGAPLKEKKPPAWVRPNPAQWGKEFEGSIFDPSDYSQFEPDLREQYRLENPEWKYDVLPEMIDGKNVIDYIDPDIDRMLEELEREEEQQQEEFEREMEDNDLEVDEEDLEAIAEFHRQRKYARAKQIDTQQSHGQAMRRPIDAADFKDALVLAGMTPEQAEQRTSERAKSRSRGRESMIEEANRKRARSTSGTKEKIRERSLGSPVQRQKALKLRKDSSKERNREGKKGEGDRVVTTKMPKHLFSGKAGFKRDRR